MQLSTRGMKVMLDTLLPALGIKIEAAAVEQAFEASKDALPKLAITFEEMNAKLARIEKQLEEMKCRQNN